MKHGLRPQRKWRLPRSLMLRAKITISTDISAKIFIDGKLTDLLRSSISKSHLGNTVCNLLQHLAVSKTSRSLPSMCNLAKRWSTSGRLMMKGGSAGTKKGICGCLLWLPTSRKVRIYRYTSLLYPVDTLWIQTPFTFLKRGYAWIL